MTTLYTVSVLRPLRSRTRAWVPQDVVLVLVARCDPRLFPRLQHANYNTGYVPWGPEHWADSREGEVYAKCRIYSLLVSDRVRLGRCDAHTGFGHARSVECISRHRPGELPR